MKKPRFVAASLTLMPMLKLVTLLVEIVLNVPTTFAMDNQEQLTLSAINATVEVTQLAASRRKLLTGLNFVQRSLDGKTLVSLTATLHIRFVDVSTIILSYKEHALTILETVKLATVTTNAITSRSSKKLAFRAIQHSTKIAKLFQKFKLPLFVVKGRSIGLAVISTIKVIESSWQVDS